MSSTGLPETAALVSVLAVIAGGVGYLPSGTLGDGAPPVIMVSIDTLRADRVSAAGYERNATPNLDRFIRDAYYFENAYANSYYTEPSHAAVFTGEYPGETGVLGYDWRICPGDTTLASELRSRDYRTVGFTGDGAVSEMFGFSRGFETWREDFMELQGGSVPRAIQFLNSTASDRFFLFVHGYDVHTPYVVDPSNLRYADRSNSSIPATWDELWEINSENELGNRIFAFWRRFNFSDPNSDRVVNLYDNSVYEADRSFGRLMSELKEEGLYRESLIVVFSDHGEQLTRHEVDGRTLRGHHGFYPGTTRVLLAVKEPYQEEAVKVEKRVSLIDLYDAVLSESGDEEARKVSSRFKDRRWVFMESGGKRVLLGEDYKIIRRLDSFSGGGDGNYSLYSTDTPYLRNDLKQERPEKLQLLKNELERYPDRNVSDYCRSGFENPFTGSPRNR